MYQLFQNNGAVALVGVIALLMLAIACGAPVTVPTSIPLPTYTPYPTATPQPTYTPFPTPTPVPTATPTPTPVPTATPTPTPEPTAALSVGSWYLFEESDPITDLRVFGIGLQAAESTVEFPYDAPQIAVYCQDFPREAPETRVVIFWQEHLGSGHTDIDWRVDNERPRTRSWDIRDDGTAPSSSTAVRNIIEDLRRAHKISARVHRDFAESLTAVWEPEGFEEAYKPVEEACRQ